MKKTELKAQYPKAALDDYYRDSHELDEVLIGDLGQATKALSENDSQYSRRVYCRTLLSLFEGVANNLKSYTLQFYDGMLGAGEKNILKKRIGAIEGAFHAFDLYTNVSGAKTSFKRNTEEWHVLQKAIKIRNRITHPGKAKDLTISNLELMHLTATSKVIFSVILKSHRDCAEALKKQHEFFCKACEERFGIKLR